MNPTSSRLSPIHSGSSPGRSASPQGAGAPSPAKRGRVGEGAANREGTVPGAGSVPSDRTPVASACRDPHPGLNDFRPLAGARLSPQLGCHSTGTESRHERTAPPPSLRDLLQWLEAGLRELYGERYCRLLLFGSHARGGRPGRERHRPVSHARSSGRSRARDPPHEAPSLGLYLLPRMSSSRSC